MLSISSATRARQPSLANEGCRARVALEIESIPAILELVLQGDCHAVLAENAVRTSGQPEAFQLRPIGPPPLVATLWMATSAQRPRGPLIEQGTQLVRGLFAALWGDEAAAGPQKIGRASCRERV